MPAVVPAHCLFVTYCGMFTLHLIPPKKLCDKDRSFMIKLIPATLSRNERKEKCASELGIFRTLIFPEKINHSAGNLGR